MKGEIYMGEILASFLVDHWALLMLLTYMLATKKYRIFGMILLVIQVAWGWTTWVGIAVVFIMVCVDIARWHVLGWYKHDVRKPHPRPKQQSHHD